MAMTMVMVMMVIFMVAVIGAGLVILHHMLERRDKQVMMEQFKKDVIPELEAMTYRMLDKSMDILPDKMVEMTKKLLKAQKEFEQEDFYTD